MFASTNSGNHHAPHEELGDLWTSDAAAAATVLEMFVCVCVIVGGLLAVGLATNILKNLLVLEPRLPPFLVFVIHVLYTSDIH